MGETTARDALLAEVLGELYSLRDDVAHLMIVIPDARAAIEKGGELATLKFAAQTDKTASVLDARIGQVTSAVKDIGVLRETLVGALTAHAAEHAKTQLLDAVRQAIVPLCHDSDRQRFQLALYGACGGFIGGAIVAAALVALRLF